MAAHCYARRFHDEIGFDEYLQLASIGLLEAMDRFDPERGAQFRTFAARRMHGAILNGLEHLTEKQQQIAMRQRLRAERLDSLKSVAGDDCAGAPHTPEQLLRFVSELGIGLAVCWMLEGTAMVEDTEAVESAPFYRSIAIRQLRERLHRAIDGLPEHERTVVRSHYLQDLPFDRIAAMLHLTKGRISQLHKQALLHLRAQVAEHADWNTTF
jgi:RNA polymerase sigma factor for flagellar operon FliA